jgi:Fuc2NAc and GlcNAc transferase
MSADGLMVIATVFVASALLTGVIRRFAPARGMLDIPNSRSSHLLPTPRGGEVAIVLPDLLLTMAAAAAGFLIWNRPAARIFMGGAGSS